jgi:ABC-type Fe3+ transport system, periplasmic component
MKKKLLFSAAVALSLALVGCSNGSSTSATTAPSSNNVESTGETDAANASGTVVVYSPHDADPLNAGINEFMKAYPNIKVEVVAAGTGELLKRVEAEAANPLADVVWGGGADSLAAYKEYFDEYVTINDSVIADVYKDPDGKWIGESPLPMVIFYNKELIGDYKIPDSWEDLVDPHWKGQIAYADPTKSGSSYTQLCTMILAKGGETAGWDFVERFYENLDGKIMDSSGKCHKLVKDGEYAIGVTLEKSAVLYEGDDSVGFTYFTDGNSAVPDGVALVKGAKNAENAKIFIDYVTGLECQRLQSENFGRRPIRSDLSPIGNIPPLDELQLVDFDFDWAANNKADVFERWQDIVVGN